MAEFKTFCILCRAEIPEQRHKRRSNTCSDAHKKTLATERRRMVDRRRCRYCARPSTPEQRRAFQKFAKACKQQGLAI